MAGLLQTILKTGKAMRFWISVTLGLLVLNCQPVSAQVNQPNTELQELAAEFFEWRRVQQPAGGDDIPRVERPDGWTPDYSLEALGQYQAQYRRFKQRLAGLDREAWSLSDQVDARLLLSAIERVYWELEVLQAPYRNPLFYVDQTLGSLFELLIISSPFTENRALNLLIRLERIPVTLASARQTLVRPVRPFAAVTMETLDGIEGRLDAMAAALKPEIPAELHQRLDSGVENAARALEDYSAWLASRLNTMQTAFAIGPVSYQWFLSHVALIPHTPGELLAQGRQAWERAVALDAIEHNRNRELPELPLFESADRQIRSEAVKEEEIRNFLRTNELMTVPDWLRHYRYRLMPAWLEPLAFMGVTDDLTSETRLDEDAYSYIREPSPDLPYFSLSAARDPRPLIIHEGVPGHYYQLARSWAHPNPIRRRYFDSSANEGIGFYVEELMLRAGLFDFSPKSREIIYSFMRLRALRVEVDIRLAVGDFTIEQAGEYLARTVPMDRATAAEEAVFFAFNPGQAISYQIGKLQILDFLAEARLEEGEQFSLLEFHEYLMRNGNVPIALQRWEYLGQDDDMLRLGVLRGDPVTVPQ
jgi:hypothetical protein